MSSSFFGVGATEAEGAAVADGTAAATAGVAAGAAPPSMVNGIGSLWSVTYFSLTGSKNEKTSGGNLSFRSLALTTISKLFVPLMPTSSSWVNFSDGG